MIRPRYKAHKFPHRDARYRVRVARKRPRMCDTIKEPTPEGHTRMIPQGAQYMALGLPPGPDGRGGWKHVDLCAACAIDYELAEELSDGELDELEEARG